MIWRNRIGWPQGAFNPRPVKATTVAETQLQARADENNRAAAQEVQSLLDYYPGFDG